MNLQKIGFKRRTQKRVLEKKGVRMGAGLNWIRATSKNGIP